MASGEVELALPFKPGPLNRAPPVLLNHMPRAVADFRGDVDAGVDIHNIVIRVSDHLQYIKLELYSQNVMRYHKML